jgi:hypothetical protein
MEYLAMNDDIKMMINDCLNRKSKITYWDYRFIE